MTTAGLAVTVEVVGHATGHGAVKGDALLDDRETFWRLHHLLHIFGKVLRLVASHLEAHRAVVDAHLVAYLAAQEFVDRQVGRLTGNVPERHFDRAHRRAPGFERAQPADPTHHPLDIGGVGPQDQVTVEEYMGLEIRLGPLGLAITINPFVGENANNRLVADHSTAEVGDFHGRFL